MTAQYRIVHFVPNVLLGTRIPVAALVRHHGETQVVRAEQQMDARCLGGTANAALLRMVLASLDEARFDELSMSTGPHAMLDEPRSLPTSPDAFEFVRRHVLPSAVARMRQARRPRWSRQGHAFFQRAGLGAYVRKVYSPRRQPDAIPALAGAALQSIAHWVAGPTRVLLLEPIAATDVGLDEQVRRIATTFSAYRFHLDSAQVDRAQVSLCAYVLEGASPAACEDVVRELRKPAHEVLCLDRVDDRAYIIDTVMRTATLPGLH